MAWPSISRSDRISAAEEGRTSPWSFSSPPAWGHGGALRRTSGLCSGSGGRTCRPRWCTGSKTSGEIQLSEHIMLNINTYHLIYTSHLIVKTSDLRPTVPWAELSPGKKAQGLQTRNIIKRLRGTPELRSAVCNLPEMLSPPPESNNCLLSHSHCRGKAQDRALTVKIYIT